MKNLTGKKLAALNAVALMPPNPNRSTEALLPIETLEEAWAAKLVTDLAALTALSAPEGRFCLYF